MSLNWGAVALGGIAGIGAAVLLAIPVLVISGSDGFAGQALLILAGFGGQTAAGYIGGRFAGADHPVHGGLAGLLAYLVTAAIAIATGQHPAVATLAFSGLVALLLGSAGGVLAAAHGRSS